MSKEVLYSTADLWLSALFLSESNADLIDVQISRNGRETISFTFRGENLTGLAQSYCANKAQANVTRLRKKMNELRDLIFAAKKQN